MPDLPPPPPPPAPPPPAPPAPPAPSGGEGRVSRRVLLAAAAGTAAAGGLSFAFVRSRRDDGAVAPPSSTSATSASPSGTGVTTTVPTPGAAVGGASDRVLVVLQMSGGNDALNTLVPTSGHYHDARPTLGLAEDGLVEVGVPGYGLHPALAPLRSLLDAGRVAAVAGIGFSDPDRSHFAALDMWWSAAPGATFRTGWLGRWLDATATDGDSVLRSIGLGGAVPALRADVARSIGVTELSRFALAGPGVSAALVDAWTALGADQAAARLATDTFAGLDLPGGDTAAASATSHLLAAAGLIAADPGVRVVHVAVNGFDTHAGQLDAHDRLLADVGAGIAGFHAALQATGDAGRVLLITTSEFGRRVAENGSGGTDHGKAGVQFVVGDAVRATTVVGELDPSDLVDGDLRPGIDPRSLYATALDWLGEPALSDAALGATYERLPVLR